MMNDLSTFCTNSARTENEGKAAVVYLSQNMYHITIQNGISCPTPKSESDLTPFRSARSHAVTMDSIVCPIVNQSIDAVPLAVAAEHVTNFLFMVVLSGSESTTVTALGSARVVARSVSPFVRN